MINVFVYAQPGNDNCSNAINLTIGGACTSGTNINATLNGTSPTGCAMGFGSSLANKDVWYSFTATSSQSIVSVQNNGNTNPLTNFNVVVSAYTSCSGSSIACVNANGNGGNEDLIFSTTAGTTYYIRVDGTTAAALGGPTGNFCISVNEFNPPANDACTNAINLVIDAPCINGTNMSSSADGPTPNCSSGTSYANKTVWYKFTATGPWTSIEGKYISGDLNLIIAVFPNCTGSAIKCINTNGDQGDEALLVPTTAGTTYYVRVDGSGSGFLGIGGSSPNGDFCISATNVDMPPSPDGNCENAMPFCTGETYFFPAATGTTAVAGPEYACLQTIPNPAWYYMKIKDAGNITLYMSSDAGKDVDFVAWGPFQSLTGVCSQLTGNGGPYPNNTNGTTDPNPHPSYPNGNVVDCSYDARAFEYLHIINAQPGQYYMICIANYSNAQHNITFSQSNFDPNGTPGVDFGTTDCAIMNPLACVISDITANPSTCNSSNNTYSVSGEVAFANEPTTGTLIVSDGTTQTTISAPFTTPVAYTLNGITADGVQHTITATFSDTICEKTFNYTAPAACNTSCSIHVQVDNAQVCVGTTINLTANGSITNCTTPTFTWSSNPSGLNTTGANVSTIPTASTTYTVTISDGIGGQCSASLPVVVKNAPQVDAGTDVAICLNATKQLTAIGAQNYIWSPTSGLTNPNISNPIASPANTTKYFVTGTDQFGCSSKDSITVTINQLPTIEAGTVAPICKGVSATLNPTGGSSYNWSSSPGTFTSNQASPTVTPSITTTYTTTGTDALGCTGVDFVIATVNPLPGVSAGADQSICPYETATLSASGALTYIWSPNGEQTTIISVQPTTQSTYSVVGTDVNGCSNSDQVVVFIKTVPVANAGTDKSICLNTSTNLSASGGTQYSWVSNPSGFSNSTSNPSVNPTISTTYTVTVTNAQNCTAQDDVLITVNQLPIADAGSPQIMCFGTNVNLTGNGGISYKWSPGGATTQIINVSPINSTTYTTTVTDANNCTATDQVSVTVNPLPIVEAGSPVQICIGEQKDLTASGASTYDWAGQVGTTITVSPTSTTTYSVVGTDVNGCTASDNVVVTVYPIPTSDFSFESPVCARSASQIMYTGTATSGATFAWGTFGGADIATGAGSGPYNLTWNTEGTYSVCLTTTQNTCVSQQTCHDIVVNPLPAISFSSDKIEGCEPMEVQFIDNSAPVPTSWSWNFGDVNSPDNTSSLQNPTHNYEKPGQYDVRLTAVSDLGCSNSILFQDMITVHKNPVADFYQLPEVGSFENSTISFFPSGSSQNVAAWEWDFNDPNAAPGENTSFEEKPEHKYEEIGYYNVCLIVSTEYGCKDSICKEIFLREDYTFYIPNAFTPNNDGKNETWGPEGVGVDPEKYTMYVFSRWGELIFESSDLTKFWDGRDSTGKICQQGVYSYIILSKETDGVTHKYVGHVTLIK
ncbi:MAG: PKD domain-containing protein [Bacteroidota bacterium]